MSSIVLTLEPETERVLRAKALSAGLTLEGFLGRLATDEATNPRSGFGEFAEPVRKAFRDSGMTDAELADLVEEAREEIWRERASGKSP
jgi:hypothetical protein